MSLRLQVLWLIGNGLRLVKVMVENNPSLPRFPDVKPHKASTLQLAPDHTRLQEEGKEQYFVKSW